MTGRDLIVYILQNDLEDQPVCEDGRLLGFITVDEAAAKVGVGPATICAWLSMDLIPHIRIGDTIYIPDAKCDVEVSFLRYRFNK